MQKKERKDLYNQLTKLPYCEYENKFLENYNKIIQNKEVNQSLKDYLKNKHMERKIWAKCYIKKNLLVEW